MTEHDRSHPTCRQARRLWTEIRDRSLAGESEEEYAEMKAEALRLEREHGGLAAQMIGEEVAR